MKMAHLLIVVGLVCLIAGIILSVHALHADENLTNIDNAVCNETVKAEVSPQPTVQTEPSSGDENDENRKKGVEFEEYVVSRFSKKYFSLKEWRGDKCSNGNYAESNTYPDMEWTFTLHENTYRFAVECKWRANFNTEHNVRWSYKDQMDRYRRFASEKNMPVFVVLGIGGIPSNPAEVYVVPLASIHHVELSNSWLKNYSHNLSKNMYFDVPTQTLR